MRYFDRTARLSVILFILSALLLASAVYVYLLDGDQFFLYSNGNFVRAGIVFAVLLSSSFFSLLVATALRCIVLDAKEEFDALRGAASPPQEGRRA